MKNEIVYESLIQTWAASSPTFTPLQDTIPAWSGFDITTVAQTAWKVAVIDNSYTSLPGAGSIIFNWYTWTGNTIIGWGNVSIIDSYTKLLMHWDNLANPWTFIDSAGKTIIKSWNATQTWAQSRFWSSSIYLDWTSSTMLSLADNDDWDFWTWDFTIDFWVKTTQAWQAVLIYQWDKDWISTTVSNILMINTTWKITYSPNYTQYPSHNNIISTQSINDGFWHHIAIVRNGNYFRMYIDWTETWTALNMSWTIPNKTDQLSIGSMPWNNYYNRLTGYLDEIRISKWIARWSWNFAVPSSPY